MKIALMVEFNDGTKSDVDAVFADFVGFERTWQRSVVKFETEMRLTDLAWLAWHSLKRRNQVKVTFNEWVETVESLEVATEDSVIVPLENPQPTG